MPFGFGALVAATAYAAAAAHAQRNAQRGASPLKNYGPIKVIPSGFAHRMPDAAASRLRQEPTGNVTASLRAEWPEQSTALASKCVLALVVVVTVWIGVVLWSSSKPPEPAPSTQLEQAN